MIVNKAGTHLGTAPHLVQISRQPQTRPNPLDEVQPADLTHMIRQPRLHHSAAACRSRLPGCSPLWAAEDPSAVEALGGSSPAWMPAPFGGGLGKRYPVVCAFLTGSVLGLASWRTAQIRYYPKTANSLTNRETSTLRLRRSDGIFPLSPLLVPEELPRPPTPDATPVVHTCGVSRLNVHVCGLLPLGFQVVASSSIRRYMACASNVPELAVTHSSTMPLVASFHRWSSASSSNTLVIPAAVFFSPAVALALS